MLKNKLVYALSCLFCFIACNISQEKNISRWDMTLQQLDSLTFLQEHHYGIGSNFEVISDTLALLYHLPNDLLKQFDTLKLAKGHKIVIADFKYVNDGIAQKDSVCYLKIAKEQNEQGWIKEKTFLQQCIPSKPITKIIYFLNTQIVLLIGLFIFFVGLVIYFWKNKQQTFLFYKNDVQSIYPYLFILFLTFYLGSLYSIKYFDSEILKAYYFNPSLNPITQPPLLAILLFSFWGALLSGIAMLDELRQELEFKRIIEYLFSFAGVCSTYCFVVYITPTLYFKYGILLGVLFLLSQKYKRKKVSHKK